MHTVSQAHAGEGQGHRCFMAQYQAPYIKTPFFLTNSKYDAFQLSSILADPCNPGK